MTLSIRLVTPLLAALALVFAGCGDDNSKSSGGGSSDALSKSEFQSKANEICKKHNEDIDKLGTPAGFDDVAPYADKALKITDDALAKLRELTPPEEFQEDFNQWLAYGDELGETVGELKEAAANEDEEGLKAAGEKADARDKKSDAIATRIGITDCAEGVGLPDPRFTAEEVDTAVAALSADPDRFAHAQEVVTHAAPGLQRILDEALHAGGWFGEAHAGQVERVAGVDDPAERATAVRTLVAEETRLGMLVGVAVGLELSNELLKGDTNR